MFIPSTFQGTIYQISLKGGNQTKFFPNGMIGSPYTIAFDWIGRNLYIVNRQESNIELAKVNLQCSLVL